LAELRKPERVDECGRRPVDRWRAAERVSQDGVLAADRVFAAVVDQWRAVERVSPDGVLASD
jgi:hypothetical protein